MITYVCSYWLSPAAGEAREAELKRYFDLHCYLKQRMGSQQIILTNLDYPGAIELKVPPNFTEKYAFFARYFGLKQLIESGVQLPICLHDHDFFNAKDLPYDENAILVGSMVDGYFSEQAVVYPEIAKQAIMAFTDKLWSLDFTAGLQYGYGTEVRHEGLYSTEQTMSDLALQPFKSIPMRQGFNVKDQVSFDIVSHHSLDAASIASTEIPSGSHGIHGHLNKGQATEVMLDWLAENLS
ncbi:hypothetical protein [Arenicella xantha]|uniref:Uncharacterized protein n=1 Tax=Arenicella xantha TaxID=644221 RepID=A0A395JL97_9GAMM|nr:hypothetical protein [Arenicella xantha]RBP50617.1 hypothetical protein DFR28_10228 [Arenicella xantha]